MTPPPVAIGGLGGSGTRVVAQWLHGLGFHMGDDLNRSWDNLWFTLLFKHPSLLPEPRRGTVSRRLALLRAGMLGGRLEVGAVLDVLPSVARMARSGHGGTQGVSVDWVRARVASLRAAARREPTDVARWGWKEPNTHALLPHLVPHLPGLRYVHVERHGLDMAFSGNRQQLGVWGAAIDPDHHRHADPTVRQLSYWAASAERAREIGRRDLDGRFLLVRFDDLCDRPRETLSRLASFVGADSDEQLEQTLASVAATPPTRGRHLDEDLSSFPTELRRRVEVLGWS